MIAERHRLALPAGYQLGKYRFRDVLGSGGFGITYLAEDSSLGRRVAIKELLPNDIATRIDGTTVVAKTQSEEDNLTWARERFVEEGRALAACDHPNVVNVYELIEANGTAYMVTKFEDGRSLAEWLRDLGRAPDEAELRGILLPLLSGLEKVHRAGFLHRDIKPENIYLTDDGRPLLLDFGSARQAVSDRSLAMTSIVTSGYAPFEQYHEDGKQGAWSDIYALGAVMYRAITGKRPAEATRRLKADPCVKLAKAHVGAYSPKFLSAIDKALAVEPAERPQSVAAWRQLLGTGAAVAPPALPWPELLAKKLKAALENVEWVPAPVRQNPLPYLAAGIAGVFLLGILVWKMAHPHPVPIHDATPTPPPAPIHTSPASPPPGSAPTPPPIPAPRPATPPPVPSGSTPPVSPGVATGPLPGQSWQNSLGVPFAPVSRAAAHMATWKTRRSDFEAFVQATGYDASGGMRSSLSKSTKARGITWRNPGFVQAPDHPVVGVSAYDALAYCQWLTGKERKDGLIGVSLTYRLPTDEEWSAAAGDAQFPWGAGWPPPGEAVGNFAGHEARSALGRSGTIALYNDRFPATSPVGSFSANANGFFDLGGNALEWCGTWYRHEMNSDEVRRKSARLEDDGGGKTKLVLRGSSCFDSAAAMLRLDTRSADAPTARSDAIGFRVVLGPNDPAALYQLPRLLAPGFAEKKDNPDGSPGMAAPDDTEGAKVDPRMVGIWEMRGVTNGAAWTWRWDQQADGRFAHSKSVKDSGTVTAMDGRLRVYSDSTQQWTDFTYEFLNATTLLIDGPLGKGTWKRVATHSTVAKKRSDDSESLSSSSSSSNEGHHPSHDTPARAKEIGHTIERFIRGFR